MAVDLGMLIRIQAVGAGAVEADINRVSSATGDLEKKSGVATRKVAEFDRSLSETGRTARETEKYLNIAGKAIAGFITISAIRNTLDLADAYGQMSARIKLTIQDMSEYDYVQKRLLDTANKAQRPLEEMQNIFIDTSGNLRDMGFSLDQAMNIADSFSFALVRNATSAQRAETALRAYDVALNKKRVDGMMWQSISSALPSLEVSMSKIFDLPLEKIQKMGFEGKITADMLNKAFLESYEDNKRAAESMGSTVTGSLVAIQNEFKSYIGELNESTGATTVLTEALIFVSEHIDEVMRSVGILATGGLTFLAVKLVNATAMTLKNSLASIKAADSARQLRNRTIEAAKATEQQAYYAMKTAQANIALGGSYSQAAAKALDYSRAVESTKRAQRMPGSAIGGLVGLLGGKVGLIALVASAAASFISFGDSAKKTAIDLETLALPLDEILGKFKAINHIQRENTIRTQIQQEAAAYKELSEARNKFLEGLTDGAVINTENGRYKRNDLRGEFREIILEAEKSGRDIMSIINELGNKYNFSEKRIDELIKMGVIYDEQLTTHTKIKSILDGMYETNREMTRDAQLKLGVWSQITNLINKESTSIMGPEKPSDDFLKAFKDILYTRQEITAEGTRELMQVKRLKGEYGEISDLEFDMLVRAEKENEKLRQHRADTKSLKDLLGGVAEQYKDIGLTTSQITLNRALELDIGLREFALLKQMLDAIDNAPKIGGSGKTSLNYYDDALKNLNNELITTKTLTDDLLMFGDPSQYTAFREMNMELNDTKGVLASLLPAQKAVLEMKAKELDSQKQINAILTLGRDKSKELDDLEFEISLWGKSQKEIERLTYFRNLDNDAHLISIGMTEENIGALSRLIEKMKERYLLTEESKEIQENSIGAGLEAGMQQYIDNIGNMRDQFAGTTQDVLGHMEGFLVDFAMTGKLHFRDMTTSILQDISKMMIRMAMMQAVQSAMGFFSGGGHVGGGSRSFPYKAWSGGLIPEYATGGRVIDFSGGGFTGMGGMFEPKGIVHGGEYVMSKAAVNNLGVGYFEQLHDLAKSGRGFASGGSVGSSSIPPAYMVPNNSRPAQQPAVKEVPIDIHIVVNTEDGTVETNAGELSAELGRRVDVRVDKRVAHHSRKGGMLG